MKDLGIGSWIERRARISPDHPAIVSEGTSRGYSELAGRVRQLAHGLRRLGVRRRDRVGWLGPNHQAFLETLFATAKLGAVLSPVNHLLDPAAVGGMLMDSGARIVVTAGDSIRLALPSNIETRLAVGGGGEGTIEYERLLADSPDDPIDERVGLDDLCMLPYTSGTTGAAKGVMLTHGNITYNVVNLLASADFRVDDVTIAVAPFFRVGGTGVNMLPVLFKGGTVVIPAASGPDEILRLIERHRVTVGFGNPDLLDALTHSSQWATSDVSSIRFVITGGAPVPEGLILAYHERGVPLLQGYGLSEAAPTVLLLDPVSSLRKPGSAGKPVFYDSIRIARPDGSPCDGGGTGELLVSGPNVMAGYWNRPEATRRTIDENGWLHTGDAVRLDEEGYVWIVDRVEDSYVSSGHVVYPGNVERVLAEHPAVADVGVVGVRPAGAADGADALGAGGEQTGAAFVVLKAGVMVSVKKLLGFCRGRLAEHEVPRSITFVERLPRTSVGKLMRAELRRLAEA